MPSDIDNHLVIAIDVAISSTYIPTAACMDPDHLCFGISGPGDYLCQT